MENFFLHQLFDRLSRHVLCGLSHRQTGKALDTNEQVTQPIIAWSRKRPGEVNIANVKQHSHGLTEARGVRWKWLHVLTRVACPDVKLDIIA